MWYMRPFNIMKKQTCPSHVKWEVSHAQEQFWPNAFCDAINKSLVTVEWQHNSNPDWMCESPVSYDCCLKCNVTTTLVLCKRWWQHRHSFNGHFPGQSVPECLHSGFCWTVEVVVSTGAVRRAKLQSYRHHQQTNTQLFTGRMPFLLYTELC